jgi:hypothetical protein
VAVGALPSLAAPAAPSSGPASGKAAAGTAGDGHPAGALPGWPSRIPGPKLRGWVAGGSGGGHNGPLAPLPPRCGAVPPAPPPGRAGGDNGDHGARAAARGNAGNGNPLRNNNAATATVAGKADNAGQENDNRGGDNVYDDENNDKWGRGT